MDIMHLSKNYSALKKKIFRDRGVGRRRLTYGSGNSKPTESEIAQGGKEGLVVLIETWSTGLIHFTNTYHYL